MKRQWAVAGLAFLLTGCSTGLPELPELAFLHPTEEQAPEQPEHATTALVFQPDTAEPIVIPEAAETPAVSLYVQTLTDLHDDKILPSGKELELEGDIEKNRFAVYDIDDDGRDELILEISQAATENCFTAVYDIDRDGDLRRELRYEAKVTFWTNGIALAEYTDAAEHDGDFIPYAVSQYDSEQDTYTEFAYVSAIDRAALAAHDMADEYPSGADTSKTGRVYCISGDNPVDVTEYETWYLSWHNGLRETPVPLTELTIEHIKKLED